MTFKEEKTCTKCLQTKALTEFYKNARRPDGHRSECKACNFAPARRKTTTRIRPHGTKTKYDRDACRCDLCKSAKSEATKAHHARKKERLGIASYTECVDCGTETRPMTNPEVRCTSCNYKATRRDRRLALYSVEREKIYRDEVFKNSDGVCVLCSETIDFALVHPDPKSPSIDHIIPISKGGGHLYANLRVVHLICNVRRGNRTEKEEISL